MNTNPKIDKIIAEVLRTQCTIIQLLTDILNTKVADADKSPPDVEQATQNPITVDCVSGGNFDEKSITMVVDEAITAVYSYREHVGIGMGKLPYYVSKRLGVSRTDADDIKYIVERTLQSDPFTMETTLSRFEKHLVTAIAVAHRDYDHWNG